MPAIKLNIIMVPGADRGAVLRELASRRERVKLLLQRDGFTITESQPSSDTESADTFTYVWLEALEGEEWQTAERVSWTGAAEELQAIEGVALAVGVFQQLQQL